MATRLSMKPLKDAIAALATQVKGSVDSTSNYTATMKLADVISKGPRADIRAFGAIADTNTAEAAAKNAEVFSYVLSSYKQVFIQGTFYTNSIDVVNALELELYGKFKLVNYNCSDYVIRFSGPRILQRDYMIVDGQSKNVKGIQFENIAGSHFDRVTVRNCCHNGVYVTNVGNNNSVNVNYLRTEFNGKLVTENLTVVSISGSSTTAATVLSLGTSLPTESFYLDNMTGIIYGDRYYEVTAINTIGNVQQITVHPNWPGTAGDVLTGATVLLGGGLYLTWSGDNGWWNIHSHVSTDKSCGYWSNTFYGTKIGNADYEGPKVGIVTGTQHDSANSLFEHVYFEGNVRFPIVTYRGWFTVIEPLSETAKIYDLLAYQDPSDFSIVDDSSAVNIVSRFGTYDQQKYKRYLYSTNYKQLPNGNTLVLNRSQQSQTAGVVSGLDVTAQSTPNMTVAVSSGSVYNGSSTLNIDLVASVAIATADTLLPRIDLIYVNSSGVVTALTGTPATKPHSPALPTGGIYLATVAVAANATTVTTSNIKDIRVYSAANTQEIRLQTKTILGRNLDELSTFIYTNDLSSRTAGYNRDILFTPNEPGFTVNGAASATFISNNYERYIFYAWLEGTNWQVIRNIIDRRETYATAAPTAGTWSQGDRVYNTAPTAGGYEGWICVTAGTPGTWKGFGAIQT